MLIETETFRCGLIITFADISFSYCQACRLWQLHLYSLFKNNNNSLAMTVYRTKEDVRFSLLYCVSSYLLINCTWVYYSHLVVNCMKYQPPHEIITYMYIGYQEEAYQQEHIICMSFMLVISVSNQEINVYIKRDCEKTCIHVLVFRHPFSLPSRIYM